MVDVDDQAGFEGGVSKVVGLLYSIPRGRLPFLDPSPSARVWLHKTRVSIGNISYWRLESKRSNLNRAPGGIM